VMQKIVEDDAGYQAQLLEMPEVLLAEEWNRCDPRLDPVAALAHSRGGHRQLLPPQVASSDLGE